jgi:hypothetical protein
MNRRIGPWLLAALGLVLFSAPTPSASGEKPKRPKLVVRAAPRMASSPASILFTAELQGGDDLEDFHCPALEWDWDDGARSTHEADCAPFTAGTVLERRFTAEHLFSHQGTYEVKVTMRRATRVVASSRVTVIIRPGVGDMSGEL